MHCVCHAVCPNSTLSAGRGFLRPRAVCGILTACGRCTRIMYMAVLPIGEARRRLPDLVRKVAAGHPPVLIGRRGRAEAAIVAPSSIEKPVERRSLQGRMRIVGSVEDFERWLVTAREERIRAMEENLDLVTRGLRRMD